MERVADGAKLLADAAEAKDEGKPARQLQKKEEGKDKLDSARSVTIEHKDDMKVKGTIQSPLTGNAGQKQAAHLRHGDIDSFDKEPEISSEKIALKSKEQVVPSQDEAKDASKGNNKDQEERKKEERRRPSTAHLDDAKESKKDLIVPNPLVIPVIPYHFDIV